jgi:peptide/nickel transport system ATP-binding protein
MPRRDGHGTVACIRATEVDATAAVVITRPAREDPAPARTRESSQPVLIARNVSKTFEAGNGLLRRAKLHALVDVSLELEPGEAVAVVGESGSGKSTLLRLIAGLERPDGGEIDVRAGGRPQMVFQDAGSSLTPWLRVADQVGERLATGGKRKRVDARAAAGEALRAVGLPSAADAALPRALSGGQRQRAALARATLVPPSVLLCDEPTSALDASLAGAILNLLADMRTQLGVALVFVTHDLGIARLIADRILVMYLGRIVEEGPTDEVIQNPAHPYTRALLAAHEEVGSRLVQGEPASPLSVPAGCAFHPRCPVADDVCMSDRPPLAEVRPSRNAACWHPFEADAVGRGSE